MKLQHRPISGSLQMEINDDGQTEKSTTHFTGNFYRRDNMDVLTFEEKNDENLFIKNLITIQQDKVSVKRTGDINMHQQFRVKQTTENVFKHPDVNIHMETYTHNLDYHAPDDQRTGELSITFTVKLNGQDVREHQLTLRIEEDYD
ncbi:DUF1934 domain-containing protein [Virgibacillus flavescens]|uniref:DUF1934 domain-containing protein n=1 Tax=Virgibacillus flavescens TaxID=1611422 RepID=UPI003D353C6C